MTTKAQGITCLSRVGVLSAMLLTIGCQKSGSDALADPPDARSIAKDAHIYAFPMVDNYATLL